MTDACRLPEERNPLAAFRAQVEHLTSLAPEVFAGLVPDVLPPLVATIRASPSEVSHS